MLYRIMKPWEAIVPPEDAYFPEVEAATPEQAFRQAIALHPDIAGCELKAIDENGAEYGYISCETLPEAKLLQLVQLTYFKTTGKYYSEGTFTVPADIAFHKIWDKVKELMQERKLPGLIEGASEFIVLCEVPGHKHDHPKLFFPGKLCDSHFALYLPA